MGLFGEVRGEAVDQRGVPGDLAGELVDLAVQVVGRPEGDEGDHEQSERERAEGDAEPGCQWQVAQFLHEVLGWSGQGMSDRVIGRWRPELRRAPPSLTCAR